MTIDQQERKIRELELKVERLESFINRINMIQYTENKPTAQETIDLLVQRVNEITNKDKRRK
jgi:TolA-binding protein